MMNEIVICVKPAPLYGDAVLGTKEWLECKVVWVTSGVNVHPIQSFEEQDTHFIL